MHSDETQQRMALLKTAREQLNNQYIQERAAAFTQWSIDCDRVWRDSGIKLPFPPPPPVPSENDIVAYALALYNAQNPQAAPSPPPPVHTVVESAPVVTTPPPVKEEIYDPEPIETPVLPIANSNITQAVAASPATPTATNAVPVAPDTLVETVPEVLPPPVPVIPKPTVIAGAADRAVGETAIKEIFAAPTADPITMTSGTPSPSVLPLIKNMLKKGLLPNWVKSDDAGIKE